MLFQAAGWKVESETEDLCTFSESVELVLHRLEGKLLVKSSDSTVVQGIADRYVDWLCAES